MRRSKVGAAARRARERGTELGNGAGDRAVELADLAAELAGRAQRAAAPAFKTAAATATPVVKSAAATAAEAFAEAAHRVGERAHEAAPHVREAAASAAETLTEVAERAAERLADTAERLAGAAAEQAAPAAEVSREKLADALMASAQALEASAEKVRPRRRGRIRRLLVITGIAALAAGVAAFLRTRMNRGKDGGHSDSDFGHGGWSDDRPEGSSTPPAIAEQPGIPVPPAPAQSEETVDEVTQPAPEEQPVTATARGQRSVSNGQPATRAATPSQRAEGEA